MRGRAAAGDHAAHEAHRGRGAAVLPGAPRRVHEARRPSRCARSSSPCRSHDGRAAGVNVGVDERSQGEDHAARERALKGEDFAKLVAEVSEAGSKANGGLIRPVVRRRSVSRARRACSSKLKPGEITEPLRTANGYQIFKLETRVGADAEPFDKVRDADHAARSTSRAWTARPKKFLEQAAHAGADRVEGRRLQADVRESARRRLTKGQRPRPRAAEQAQASALALALGQSRVPAWPDSMKIGSLTLSDPVALAPMAGMTDTAFRRLVKRKGGCGLVVTEMVSSEGLVRGIDRTLEYAEYTEEERPVSIQIFGGDPQVMADAAQVVEGMGADIVDINMGCPVPKIAKHNAGCSLMREPEHAASVVRAMAKAVRIPVTVKMRAGWNERRDQRARAGADGRGRRRGGGRRARPDRRAVLHRRVRLAS